LWADQVELVVNIMATFLIEFVSDAWNWFDFVVVLVSLLSLGMENLPGAQVMHSCVRVLRTMLTSMHARWHWRVHGFYFSITSNSLEAFEICQS
jgi:hypothetical protein